MTIHYDSQGLQRIMLSNIPVYSDEIFSWSTNRGAYIAKASDLPVKHGLPFFYARIYADAPDLGFYLSSRHTGIQFLFSLKKEEYFRDDIKIWHFSSECAKFWILIYND
jgi:hypothetical protein